VHPDTLRKFVIVLLLIILAATTSVAGIRGPGKYSGVVIFDRWDTCYLYSGVYVVYVSSKIKERLRRYEGKSVTINATEVFQPMNPGDGLIRKFKFLGVAKNYTTGLDQLALTVEPNFHNDGPPTLILVIENRGAMAIEVSSLSLAPTLLGLKLHEMFSPSDGKSDAWLTRAPLKYPAFLKEIGFGPKTDKTHPIMRRDDVEYYLNVEQELPDKILIPRYGKTTVAMSFKLPQGQYDFLVGYAGGVHEVKSIASKPVAFSVDENGRASLDSADPQLGRPNDLLRPDATAPYMRTSGFKQAHELLEMDFWRLLTPEKRAAILAQDKDAVLRTITKEKDYSLIANQRYWCAKNAPAILPELIKLITDAKVVGLENSADLIIWERVQSKELEFFGHGGVVPDDIFSIAGRASWILREITGQNLGAVSMKSTPAQLQQLSESWRKWYEKNPFKPKQ
jgi:hypothetical protein